MKAVKFLVAGSVILACAIYPLSEKAVADPKGEKPAAMKKNKFAKQMIAHREKLSDKQLRQFRITRMPVSQMREIVDRAEKMGAVYIAFIPAAYDKSSAKYFASYNEDGTATTDKTVMTETAKDLEGQTTIVVAIEDPTGGIEIPETYVKTCPPPESCDRDTIQARLQTAGY